MCAGLRQHCLARRNNFIGRAAAVDKCSLVPEFSPGLSFDKGESFREFGASMQRHLLLKN